MTTTFHIWEGVYSSFEEAAANAVGDGFAGDVYQERALAAAQECLSALNAAKPIPPFHKQRSTLLPPVVGMMLRDRPNIRILDFGGGLGIGHMSLLESIPACREKLSYSIVELPDVCRQGCKLHGDAVAFLSELPVSGQFDLVHMASSLQYVPDWKAILKDLFSYAPEYCLMSDVFAGDVPTFATLQNYYSSKIPHWFFNLPEFTAYVGSFGYRLEMKSFVTGRRLESDDILPMENFPESHRISQTLHLLFRQV